MKSINNMFYVGKDTFKRFLPYSIAYWVVLFFAYPLLQIMQLLQEYDNISLYGNHYKFDYMETYVAPSSKIFMQIPITAIAIAFSTVMTIMVLGYLHKKRSADFFGSMPVSRREQFFGRMITVFLCTIIPIIAVCFTGSAIYGFDGTGESYAVMGKLILGVTGNIAIIGFLAICSGTIAHTIVSYLIINAIYPMFTYVCYLFPTNTLWGVPMNSETSGTFFTLLCPLAAPFTPYSGENTIFSIFGFSYSSNELLYIIWWFCLTLVLVTASFVLVKKRKSECAQNSVAFVLPNVVIKLFTTITAGWIAGFMFEFVYTSSATKNVAMYIVFYFIGFVVGSAIAHLVLHLIYHKGFSGFCKYLLLYAIEVVIGMAFYFAVITDATGYVTRVPDADDVQKVTINFSYSQEEGSEYIVNGKNIYEYEVTDKENIKSITTAHKEITSDLKSMYEGIYIRRDFDVEEVDCYDSEPYNYDNYVYITYTLNNGSQLKRYYDLNEVYLYDEKRESEIINKLYKASDYKRIGRISLNYFDTACVEIYNSGKANIDGYHEMYEMHSKAGKELTKALIEDYKKYGDLSYDKNAGGEKYSVEIIYDYKAKGQFFYETIYFDNRYKKTVKYLKSLDLSIYKVQ